MSEWSRLEKLWEELMKNFPYEQKERSDSSGSDLSYGFGRISPTPCTSSSPQRSPSPELSRGSSNSPARQPESRDGPSSVPSSSDQSKEAGPCARPLEQDGDEIVSDPRTSSLVVHRGSKLSREAQYTRSTKASTSRCASDTIFLLIPRTITGPRLDMVEEFLSDFGAKMSNQYGLFDHRTTHVVLGTRDSLFEWCQGIVFDKFVVSFDWILTSLKSGEVQDPKTFELSSDSGTPVATKGQRQNNIFKDITFLCAGPYYDLSFQEDQLKELLVAAGGTVVSKPKDPVHGDCRVCIVGTKEFYHGDKLERLIKRTDGFGWKLVWITWLYLSILRGHPQSFEAHLVTPA